MTTKAKAKGATGNFRTLISLSIGHGLVAHGYVRCRSNPDEFNARGIDRFLSELKKRDVMPATPFLLVTGPFENDEVKQILSPLDPGFARAMVEFESETDVNAARFLAMTTREDDPVCNSLDGRPDTTAVVMGTA
jgi:hypothetical protein